MNRFLLFVLLVSGSSLADDPFACVDPDVASAFLGQRHGGVPSYSTAVPDGFVKLDVPAGLTLVGSQIDGATTTVVYKTRLDVEDALAAGAAVMVDAGWAEFVDARTRSTGGFQTYQRSPASLFCHDTEAGSVSVMAMKKRGQTLVSFVKYDDPASRNCGERAYPSPRQERWERIAMLPALALPEGAVATNTQRGSHGDEVHAAVDISGTFGHSELLSYFGDQIRDQGWSLDTGWSGSLSSGTVWMLDSPTDGLLVGKLHIYGRGAGPIHVRFSFSPVDAAQNARNGSSSGTTIRNN